MQYTEEEIKKYLDILHNYSNEHDITIAGVWGVQTPAVKIAKKVIVFLFIQVIKFVNLVVV